MKFPIEPVEGQIYGEYQYSESAGAWIQVGVDPVEQAMAFANDSELVRASARHDGVGIVYTVPTGKVSYLFEMIYCISSRSGNISRLIWRDETDTLVHDILLNRPYSSTGSEQDNTSISGHVRFVSPLKLLANHDIVFTSGGIGSLYLSIWERSV